MATELYGPYAVKVGSSVIGGVTSQSLPSNTAVAGEASSDALYPTIQSISGQAPRARWSTKAVSDQLDAIGLLGFDCSATGNLTLYEQKRVIGGTRAAGSAHRSFLIQHGMAVLRQLSVEHQGDAMLECEAIATYDTSNNPVVIGESAALPSGADNAQRFTMGPIALGAISVTQAKSLSLDFGVNVTAEGGDSVIWPTHASIASVQPVLTVRVINAELFKDSGGIPLLGLNGTHANSSFFLRKRATGGTYVADITTQHIKVTIAGQVHVDTIFDGRTNEPIGVSVQVRALYDGTNLPVVITTGVAIS